MINNTLPILENCFNNHTECNFEKDVFKSILEQLPVPVIAFDNNLCFISASARFFDESPLNKEDVKPHDHWYKLIPDMPIKWKIIHQRCLKGEMLKCDEDQFPRHDGSIEWWKWEIKSWFLPSGVVGGIILYVENITQKKIAEENIEKNIRLLEKSNNTLSKFAHTCAHDLNQSLRTVALYAQLLQNTYSEHLNPSIKSYTGQIIKTIDQMKIFISNTLNFSNLKNKNIIMENVCMQEVVDNVVMMLNNEIIYKQAMISFKDLPLITGNKMLLIQVMQNLISNSLKYSGESKPAIDIKAVDKGKFWLFSVRDNGMGIEKRHLKKIFSEHKRFTSGAQKGAGLGLHHSKKIIKEHGGVIWATSSQNKGMTIHFTLPKPLVLAQNA